MTARLRVLLHELADELANTLESNGEPVRAPAPPPSGPRPRKAPIYVDAPLPPVSEVDAARARALLRKKGFSIG